MADVVVEAEMDIYLPDGEEEFVQMHDDGLHGDLEADDGIYGALIPATEVGIYRATAVIKGKTSDGTQFIRSTEHLIPVVEDKIAFTGQASGSMKDDNRMAITLPVTLTGSLDDVNPLYTVYTEVWGTDGSGNEIPVCWLSTMAPVKSLGNQQYTVELELNMKWVSWANAREPFTLKNALLQDPYVYVPLDQAAEIPLTTSVSIDKVMAVLNLQVTEITREMRVGIPPPEFANANISADARGIMLLHGYCSSSNPWQGAAKDFTSPYFFLDPDSSVPHQTFAELVHSYANANGIQAFSALGHSQGGAVALHLLNYYFSGMEHVKNGRIIQSVGSPYMGCSAAGSAANLGKAFGIGCGENFDLSTDGAQLWLRGITSEHRKEVYYYTTTYEQGKFFGDYCNLAINMVLEWPNDGTAELEFCQLAGGNNMGNK